LIVIYVLYLLLVKGQGTHRKCCVKSSQIKILRSAKKVGTLLHAAVSKTSHQRCLETCRLLFGIWDSTEQ